MGVAGLENWIVTVCVPLSVHQMPSRWWWTDRSLRVHTTNVCTNTCGGTLRMPTLISSPTLAVWRVTLPTAWRSSYSEWMILPPPCLILLPILPYSLPSPSSLIFPPPHHFRLFSNPSLTPYIQWVNNPPLPSLFSPSSPFPISSPLLFSTLSTSTCFPLIYPHPPAHVVCMTLHGLRSAILWNS